ncbi:hypothetical protein MCOR27_003385 [Pyricularia oryzae]|uniref:Uncharacterized protein n=1 Tax=Pyricularia grisea TaxID=148305 RepID=A0ABQ8NPQ6_PYRGI|nr:hypothetical protein MCOR19_004306 [Pyricularia oryzae]KAI6300297.1 hypothetical protein MCOR33_003978 [Pyricularia grisea]KAI6270277.1 hypothetical protein MCOR26_008315 [Pyricularia oryzae]KAI6283219.1 hypothetical protein MCOR27_003385 [Pyricularia oryzae]KAI6386488.1 hypothetical protein MCOR24_011269 [Pyricularia oryzae]
MGHAKINLACGTCRVHNLTEVPDIVDQWPAYQHSMTNPERAGVQAPHPTHARRHTPGAGRPPVPRLGRAGPADLVALDRLLLEAAWAQDDLLADAQRLDYRLKLSGVINLAMIPPSFV